MVRNTSIGEKDAQMSLFSLWKGVFQLPSAKRFVKQVDNLDRLTIYVQHLLSLFRHQIGCVVDLALQGNLQEITLFGHWKSTCIQVMR